MIRFWIALILVFCFSSGTIHADSSLTPTADDQSISVNEQTASIITLSATDPNGLPLTFTIHTLPEHGILSDYGTGSIITEDMDLFNYANQLIYLSSSDSEISDLFTFSAKNDFYVSDIATVSISINGIDDPIEFISSPSLAATENSTYLYTFEAIDPDGGTIDYQPVLVPTWLFFDADNLTISGIPSNFNTGDNQIVISASSNGQTVLQSFSVVVNDVNVAPEFMPVPLTGSVDTIYTHTMDAIDPDGDDVTISLESDLPDWLNYVDSLNYLYGTPTSDDIGDYELTFSARDDILTTTYSFTISIVSDLNAISYLSSPDLTVNETGYYAYYIDFEYSGTETLTVTTPTLPDWLELDTMMNAITGIPTNSDVGDHPVVISISNGTHSYEQAFTITVINLNDPPTILSTPIETATENVLYVYPISVEDIDGDTITMNAELIPDWLSLDENTGILSGTPPSDFSEINEIIISVGDGEFTIEQQFWLTVEETLDPPLIISNPVTEVYEDADYNYFIDVENSNSFDETEFSAAIIPNWASIDSSNGYISGIPTNDDVGSHPFSIQATSTLGGGTATQNFTVIVTNTNDFPEILDIDQQYATENLMYEFTIPGIDIDGDTIEYGYSLMPDWLNIEPDSGIISGIPGPYDIGFHSLQITATSGENNDISYQSFSIFVENINDAPIFVSTPLYDATEDSYYNYVIDIEDSDSLDISLSILEGPDWLQINDSILTGLPTNNAVGTHRISIDASDGILTTNQSFDITVVNINDAPEITTSNLNPAIENTLYSESLPIIDIDGDALIFEPILLPEWLSLDENTGILTGTPGINDIGTNNIGISVSDDTESISQYFELIVNNLNDAPSFISAPITDAIQNVNYTYAIDATDLDGDSIIISATILPEWLTFDNATNSISGTPTNNHVGDHNIEIIASDDENTSTQNFVIVVENVDDPPQFNSTPIVEITEDTNYTYIATGIDIDGDDISFSATLLPDWLTFNDASSTLSGTPSNDNVGNHNITISAHSNGVTVNQTFNISVINIDDPPEFISDPITVAMTGFNYSYYVLVDDIDTDILTLSITSIPDWLTFDDTTGLLTGTPNSVDDDNSVSFELVAGDITVAQAFDITISDADLTLAFDSSPIQSIDEDSEYSYTVSATDVNSNLVTYESISIPNWLSFESGILSGTPSNDDVGNHSVVIEASTDATSVFQTFTITVENTNDVPVFISEPIESTLENTPYNYFLSIEEIDLEDTIVINTSELPEWLTFDSDNQVLTGTPSDDDIGEFNIEITAISGDDTISQSFTLTVVNVNDAAAIHSSPPSLISEDELLSYTIEATDVDNDPITFVGNTIPYWLTFNEDTGTLEGTPGDSEYGSYEVIIYVRSGIHTTIHDFTIFVINKPDVPMFTSDPITAVSEDSLYAYEISVEDLDPLDTVLQLSSETLPNWLTLDDATQLLSGTPTNDDVGDHDITIYLQSGEDTVEQTFTITVSNTNDVPVFSSTPIVSVDEDSLYQYQIIAIDDDGDDININIESIPDWLSFDESSLVISGIPTNDQIGNHSISISATSGSDTATQSFVITVNNVNDTPTFTSTPITLLNESEQYTYVIDVHDDDGDDINLIGTELPTWLTFDPSTQILSGIPSESDAGRNTVIITAHSGDDEVTHQFTIIVKSLNSAPQFTSSEITTAIVNEVYEYEFSFLSNSVDEAVTVTVTELPDWLAFDDESNTISGTPEYYHIGDHPISIKLDSIYGSDTQSFIISVADFELIIDTTGTGFTLTDSGSLIDSSINPELIFSQNKTYLIKHIGNSHPFYFTINNEEKVVWNNNQIYYTAPNDTSLTGLYISLYRVTWSNGVFIQEKQNMPPAFTTTPTLTAIEDYEYSTTFKAVDVDSEDSVLYQIITKPDWISWDSETLTLSGTPSHSDIGDHSIKITATSGADSVTQSFIISVTSDYSFITDNFDSLSFSDGDKQKINSDLTIGSMLLSSSNLKVTDGNLNFEELIIDTGGEFFIEDGKTTISNQLELSSGSKMKMSNGVLAITEFILSESDFEIDGGDTEIDELTIDSSSSLSFSGGYLELEKLVLSDDSTCNLTGGSLIVSEVSGDVTNSGSALIIGFSDSDISSYSLLYPLTTYDSNTTFIDGSYTQNSDATLIMNINGTETSDYGKLIVTDTIIFDGELQVLLSDDISLESGASFKLFTANSIEGSFSNIDLPDIDSSLEWDISELYSTGTLSVVTAGSSSITKTTIYTYPNPAERDGDIIQIYYHLELDYDVSLEIYNIFGRQIYSTSFPSGTIGGSSGDNIFELDSSFIDDLSIGVYFILIHNGSSTLGTGKFVVK